MKIAHFRLNQFSVIQNVLQNNFSTLECPTNLVMINSSLTLWWQTAFLQTFLNLLYINKFRISITYKGFICTTRYLFWFIFLNHVFANEFFIYNIQSKNIKSLSDTMQQPQDCARKPIISNGVRGTTMVSHCAQSSTWLSTAQITFCLKAP